MCAALRAQARAPSLVATRARSHPSLAAPQTPKAIAVKAQIRAKFDERRNETDPERIEEYKQESVPRPRHGTAAPHPARLPPPGASLHWPTCSPFRARSASRARAARCPAAPHTTQRRRDSDLRKQLADHYTQNLRLGDTEGDGDGESYEYEYEYEYDYTGEYETEWEEGSPDDSTPGPDSDRAKEGAL